MEGSSEGPKCKRAFVLDAAAFFAGIQLLLPEDCVFTTPSVLSEVKDEESRSKLEASMEAGKVKVAAPSSKRKLGDARLTEADKSVLLLALELKESGAAEEVVVVTDDYALQSAAKTLGLRYAPVKTLGIDKSPRKRGRGEVPA